jgi:heat-inducible transcriptional repressor
MTANGSQRPLNERECAVLSALVYEYITTGKPVGSRSFVQKYSFSISPATMRNIMFDLERMGYLMQPHTSAGRVPTDMGYRFYVDSLLDTYEFVMNEKVRVKEELIKREVQLDKMFSAVSKMLSLVSTYAGIVLTPKPDFTVVKRI